MKLKKIFFASLLGLLLLVNSGCSSAVEAESDYNLVKQELVNVRYKVPGSWLLQASTSDNESVNQYSFDGGLFQVAFTTTSDKISDANIQQAFINDLLTQLPDATIDNLQEVTIDLNKAYQYDLKFTLDGVNYVGNVLMFDLDNGYMTMTFAVDEKNTDYSNVFDTIKDSISIPILSSDPVLQQTQQNNELPAVVSNFDESTNTYQGDVASIKIDGLTQTTDYYDNPALKINFTITNTSDTPLSVVQLLLTQLQVVQANAPDVLLSNAILTDSDNAIDLNRVLQPNESLDGYYAVTLKDNTNPVLVQFKANANAPIDHTLTYDLTSTVE